MSHNLTRHAFDRVFDRLHMKPEELIRMLDNNLTVPIGKERNKTHRLFYSELDDDWFVAVVDDGDEVVVTILLITYYNETSNRMWLVSETAMENARDLVLRPETITQEPVKVEEILESIKSVKKEPPKEKPKVIRAIAHFYTPTYGVRIKRICCLPVSEHGTDLVALVRNPLIQSVVQGYLKANIEDGESVDGVYLSIGRRAVTETANFDLNTVLL